MRVTRQHVFRFGNAHQIEHALRFFQRVGVAFSLVQSDRLGNLLPHREHRVERGHRLLENHGHIGTANAPQLGLRQRGQVDPLLIAARQPHLPAVDIATALLHQTHQRQRGDRLAGARLADDRQRFALAHVQRQPVYRLDAPALLLKADAEIAHRQHHIVMMAKLTHQGSSR